MISNIISKTIMWLLWGVFAVGSVTVGHYATGGIKDLNAFSKPFDIVAAVLLIMPLMGGIGIRAWLGFIRNPWLVLLLFVPGLFLANQTAIFGPFVVPDYCIIYQVAGGLLFAIYLPRFVRLRKVPPKTPPTLPDTTL